MRFAYADPPYPGQSWRLYGDHPDYAGEVDHGELVERLMDEYRDGWALSTSAAALHAVLPLCPAPEPSRKSKGRYLTGTGTRVMAWVKPNTPWRPVGVQFAWEPILVYGGRPRDPRNFTRDWLSCSPRTGFTGGKPEPFCRWLFDVLGARQGDELVDLFPGSGGVGASVGGPRAARGGRIVVLLTTSTPHLHAAPSAARERYTTARSGEKGQRE